MALADCTTKTQRIAYFRKALATSPKWAARGLMRIYQNQTEDEREVEDTRHENGIGFTGVDAGIMSSFAKQVEMGRSLSPKQMAIVFKKMPKYAKQLESVSYKPVEQYKADVAAEIDRAMKDRFAQHEREMEEEAYHREMEEEAVYDMINRAEAQC